MPVYIETGLKRQALYVSRSVCVVAYEPAVLIDDGVDSADTLCLIRYLV